MASPVTVFIRPCALRIALQPEDRSNPSDKLPPNSDAKETCRKYMVLNTAEELGTSGKTYRGYLSPTARLTLPKIVKRKANIPDDAAYYSFIHPPIGLINDMDVKKHMEQGNEKGIDSKALMDIAVCGGYIYFGAQGEVVRINAISFHQGSCSILRFSGPFHVGKVVCDVLRQLHRPKPLVHEALFEAGFVENAWVRPNEKFRNIGLTDKLPHRSGALLFFRDDGTASAYIIDPTGTPFLDTDVGSLSGAFMACLKTPKEKMQDYTKPVMHFNPAKWKDQFKTMDEGNDLDVSKIMRNINDKKTLLHLAFQSNLESKWIEKILKTGNEKGNLSHPDNLGWTPLHYACRFTPTRRDLIEKIIDYYEGAVLFQDKYGRFPIHIACDSNCTPEVITALLKYHPSIQIEKTSTHIKRNPLHLACLRRTYFDIKEAEIIVEKLVEADTGKAVRMKDVNGRLPLHGAIQMKMAPKTIKALLNKYKASDDDDDITTDIKGKLPLHLACWNNSPSDTVKLLLDKDKIGNTIILPVDKEAWSGQRLSSKIPSFKGTEDGTRALHLAAVHGSPDVIRHIILSDNGKLNTATTRDENGRYPLHIACANNVNPSVIKMLLQEDPEFKAIKSKDCSRSMPIHLLCANSNANPETLELLLDAEEELMKKKRNKTCSRSSTRSVDNRNRSPLLLAVKAEASDEMLDILLRPNHFYLKGFDAASNSLLAERINRIGPLRTNLQDHIINTLSERESFFVLIIELYSNVLALFMYRAGSYAMLNDDDEMNWFYPIVLTLCTIIFIIRELVQIKSQSTQYISDIWSWQEIACIAFLIYSLRYMYMCLYQGDNFDNGPINENIILLTVAMLTLQVIFFLRSTFLPFARFVGGLLLIFNTLIPFFIVSILLLLAFAYCYRLLSREDGEGECNSLGGCTISVLESFFSGKDDTENFLDIIFGVIAVIVLLNVVIAIVDEAWTSAANHATRLYWDFRLDFLSETRSLFYSLKKKSKSPKFHALATWIDNVRDVKFSDVCWTREPYNQVDCKKKYDNPEEWFIPEMARVIRETHSLQADLYWTKKEFSGSSSKMREIKVILKWVGLSFLYLFLIILGFATAGFFFPRSFRKFILSVGIKDSYLKMEYVAKKNTSTENEKS